MPQGETTLIKLAVVGAVMALGKLLVGDEKITLRQLTGRVILGSGVSMIAGVALIHYAHLGEIELIGLASALGVIGHTYLERLIVRFFNKKMGNKNETQ